MSTLLKWITGTAAALLCLAVLALGGAWRLGLLPLLFPPPPPVQPFPISDSDTLLLPGILEQLQSGASQPGASPHAGSPAGQPDPGTGAGGTTGAPTGDGATPGAGAQAQRDRLRHDVEVRYCARLLSLARGYEKSLNSLVDQAFNEYMNGKKRGENVSAIALARKYIPEGSALEKQCDTQFYAALGEFKDELRRNGLPPDTAALAQKEYEYAKAKRKKEILAGAARLI